MPHVEVNNCTDAQLMGQVGRALGTKIADECIEIPSNLCREMQKIKILLYVLFILSYNIIILVNITFYQAK